MSRRNPLTVVALTIVAIAPPLVAACLPPSAAAATRDAGLVVAYLDPGAGSVILQAIVASLAGAAVAVGAYWRRIKRFLGIEAEAESDREAAAPRDE